jgi:soluble lytic murein transglycosylase-like protein
MASNITDIINSISSIFQQTNVPSPIWESIAQTESSFNPNAIGDNNTSFGLFQLHVGGQAPAGVPTSQLLNPVTNASYAAPAISSAWNTLGGSFNDSLSWWEQFAVASGHPGGSLSNSATISEAQQLKSNYDAIASGQQFAETSYGTSTPVVQGSTSNNLGNFFSNTGLTVLFFIIASVLLVIGFMVLK